MSDSLRDQLLGLGFKPPARQERRPVQEPARTSADKPGHGAGTRAAEAARKSARDAQRAVADRPDLGSLVKQYKLHQDAASAD